MSLHAGLDTVGIISQGLWSKTYHLADLKIRCNLYASRGYLEDAPNIAGAWHNVIYGAFRRLIKWLA